MKNLLLSICTLFVVALFAQTNVPPKREFRAAWIATVNNLDYPSSKTLTADQQRAEFVSLLDQHRAAGIRAVVVQIRSVGDALYPTDLAPWSEYLTGVQGRAPVPYYDPLAFMIAECRKRGMEFHAWFNPYRAVSNIATAVLDSTHVARRRPEWLLAQGTLRILDPAIPEVRAHITQIVMDVLRRYDIDGVHFDDYFYPYPPATGVAPFNDDSTFARHPRGFTVRADWRRNNVDLLIQTLSDSIRAVKPWVKFGISPFGIWQNQFTAQPNGSATRGLESYNDLYCDTRKWLQAQWIDYCTPQLYWYIGFSVADYSILLPWWSRNANGRHIYVGQGAYRVGADANWNAAQIPAQLQLNRQTSSVLGSIYYNTTSVNRNPLGLRDSLKNTYYAVPALMPTMEWKDNVSPNRPTNLSATLAANLVPTLTWTRPTPQSASELDRVRQYVIYRFENTAPIDLTNPRNIVAITNTDSTTWIDAPLRNGVNYTYVVTALDRLHNESEPSASYTFRPNSTANVSSPTVQLLPVAPNPFVGQTLVRYQLTAPTFVTLRVVDMLGKTVKILVNTLQASGEQEVVWDATGQASGVYSLQLEVNGQAAQMQKMVVMH